MKLAADEKGLAACYAHENGALALVKSLEDQLADLQCGADPTKLGAIMKASAKLRIQIAEAKNTLQDARDISDRLQVEIGATRQKLDDVETLEDRQKAAQSVDGLHALVPAIEKAANELIAALQALRSAGLRCRGPVTDALMAIYRGDHERMLDAQPLVVNRAAAVGPEMAVAVGNLLRDIEEASGCDLRDQHEWAFTSQLSESRRVTVRGALQVAAETVAGRLGVTVVQL